MFLHAYPSMFVSSLREFPENCVYKHSRLLKLFCSIFIQKIIITANFLSYDIESAKKKNAFIGFAY